jgi:ribosomal protein S18 acetylase RimI-like enzyme
MDEFIRLASLIERQEARAMVELAAEARPVAGGWMTFGGPGAYVNKACALGLDGPVAASEVDALVDFFGARGVLPRVELCPFADRSLLHALAGRGFGLLEFRNVLFRRLIEDEDPRRLLPGGWPTGLEVERIDPASDAQVDTFVRVSGSGFTAEGEPISAVFSGLGVRAARLPGYDAFLARLDGEVAGAAGCATRDGVTALFGASVLPAFRRRGLQQALLVARLERGRERGSTLATVVASPGLTTERNASRLRFRMAYARAVLEGPGGAAPVPAR